MTEEWWEGPSFSLLSLPPPIIILLCNCPRPQMSLSFGLDQDSLQPDLLWYFFFRLQDPVLWACLATMAAYAKDLNTAETAYAAIDEVCIVTMIQLVLYITIF